MLKKFFKKRPTNSQAPAPESVDEFSEKDTGQLADDLFLQELDLDQVQVIPRPQHCISRQDISPNALKVLYKLDSEGFPAFLVGGGVRDLLIGNKPKDFDIATSATPEQLKQLFRNARIIGRRFKIVHIRFGREVIEVTTFRAHHKPDADSLGHDESRGFKHLDSAHSSAGMILRDNVYGDITEDAMRRDFTVNALYYTIRKFRILDFTGGLNDINDKLIRIIGDPATRYKEDPVRMLRAIRFSAKLGFEIEPLTRRPIDELAPLLESISPARLFDEILKLLSTGNGEKTFELLQQFAIGKYLFPATLQCINATEGPESRLLELALKNTDSRLAEGKSVTPAFLVASLLWPVLRAKLKGLNGDNTVNMQDLHTTSNQVISQQLQYTSIPKRFSIAAREIWELQFRLERRNKRSAISAFEHPRFRAAYDFLLLREDSGEDLGDLGKWWTDFQISDTNHQSVMLNSLTGKTRRRRTRRRKPADGTT